MSVSSSPLISVIIPCFNAEKYAKNAINSILHQTYKNLEIILINDGSKDHTAEICKKLSINDSRIIYIENSNNEGLIYTLNKGIAISNGAFIARMDADDVSLPERLEKQLDYFKANPDTDVLGTNSFNITGDDEKLINSNPIYCNYNTLKISALFAQPLIHGSVLAKAEWLKNNLYDEGFKHSEDFELWLRLLSKGAIIRNLNERLYCYRLNEQGVSQQNTSSQQRSHNKASKYHLHEILNRPLSDKVISILNCNPLDNCSYADFKQAKTVFKQLFKSTEFTEEIKKFKVIHQFNMSYQLLKCTPPLSFSFYMIIINSITNGLFWQGLMRKLRLLRETN